MSSLFASLGIAREALQAQQYALDVTQNNIANVNTAGYSRQRVTMAPGDPWVHIGYQVGIGVKIESVDSFRSRFFDHRVNDELQKQGEFAASSATLQQVEALFNEAGGAGLQASISAFFNSFSSLANAPEDISLRQQVIARGEQMGDQFRQLYEQLQAVQSQQDLAIADTVGQINYIAQRIARLNVEVQAARGSDTNILTLFDQRQQLLDQLAGLTDISYFETESGSVTVQSRQGTLLVAGDAVHAWEASQSPAGPFLEVYAEGSVITSSIQSGKLAGLLKVRDGGISAYLTALDEMAVAIVARVNQQHALGADLDGAAGGEFFIPFSPPAPGSSQGAARSMMVAVTDPSKIAAASPGAGPGSNANANLIAEIQNEPLLSGNSTNLIQSCGNLVFRIGLDTQVALDGVETQKYLLTQLQNQRDAEMGVSLDDEAVNIMKYQKAYEANARVINLIDSLTEDLLRLLGG